VKFEVLKALDFGPFKGQELVLAPGLTVVHGPNEAGKSTWHAALYAGLCGMRRGRGRQADDDRDFRDRHKPWNSNRWRVAAVVSLEDGRRIELQHDLEGRVDCRAKDLLMGRDYSGEIMFDGSPDGSRWLGLDRRSFLATACVRQTQVLQVKDNAQSLQQHLQRATDTAGVDQTAAAALERIDAFRADNVGQIRVNSNRPLPRAMRAVDEARKQRERARQEHAEYLRMIAEADRLRLRAEAAQSRLRLFRAASARRLADAEITRLQRARELANRFPQGAPTGLAADDVLAQEVRAAIHAWEQRPPLSELQGQPLEALRAELAALPSMPAGDSAPAQAVTQARDRLVQADRRLANHAAGATAHVPRDAPGASSGAAQSGIPGPSLIGGALGVVGLGLVLVGLSFVGIILLVAGLIAWAVLTARQAKQPSNSMAALDMDWQERTAALERARIEALDGLATALRARSVAVEAVDRGALDVAYDDYVAQCLERRSVAAIAARREDLVARINDRQLAESSAVENLALIGRAREALLAAAHRCDLDGLDEAAIAQSLRRWLDDRSARLVADEQERREWIEFTTLLGDESMADIEERVRRLTREADVQSEGVVGSIDLEADVPAQRERLEAAVSDACQAADQALGMTQERRKLVHLVAEAEEALVRAEAEVAELRQLDSVLERTREFLAIAQDRVHRDIAPVLAEGLRAWLPRVTNGRYTHVVVDPQTLEVQVSGSDGQLRYAHLLSHGTAEQIYLLLRAVMARHLTEPGEVCPLVLDDVTVHCDAERQQAVLDVLRELSTERQVILFTQEDAVLKWARQKLVEPRDRIVELTFEHAVPQ
jgi:exonuclease SbcC